MNPFFLDTIKNYFFALFYYKSNSIVTYVYLIIKKENKINIKFYIIYIILKILFSEVLIMITNIKLTTKEKYLLQDQASHEEICIQKYSNYANKASDKQLQNLFQSIGKQEQNHLDTINQLLSGQVPSMNSGQSGSNQSQSSSSQSSSGQSSNSQSSNGQSSSSQSSSGQSSNVGITQSSDKDLCTDILMTEKYVSGAYNTAIFEFKDTQVRDVLNHIQKEEQKHGEAIFKYMESKGMYSAQ